MPCDVNGASSGWRPVNGTPKKVKKKDKDSFYIAQYPVRWTAQSAFSTGANSHRRPNKENRSTYLTEKG